MKAIALFSSIVGPAAAFAPAVRTGRARAPPGSAVAPSAFSSSALSLADAPSLPFFAEPTFVAAAPPDASGGSGPQTASVTLRLPLGTLFDGRDYTFVTDKNVRGYEWTTKEADILLDDLTDAALGTLGAKPDDVADGAGSNLPEVIADYELSQIVLVPTSDWDSNLLGLGNRYDVYDGQQRLVTLNLILAGLRDAFQSEAEELSGKGGGKRAVALAATAGEIQGMLLPTKVRKDDVLRITLRRRDNVLLQKILMGDADDEAEEDDAPSFAPYSPTSSEYRQLSAKEKKAFLAPLSPANGRIFHNFVHLSDRLHLLTTRERLRLLDYIVERVFMLVCIPETSRIARNIVMSHARKGMDNEPIDDFKGLVCFRYTMEEGDMYDTFDKWDALAAEPSPSLSPATPAVNGADPEITTPVGRDIVAAACLLRASAALRAKIRSRGGDEVFEWERWIRRELWQQNQRPPEDGDKSKEEPTPWQGKDFFVEEVAPASVALYKFRLGKWDEFAFFNKTGKGKLTKQQKAVAIARFSLLRDVTMGVAAAKEAEIAVLELILRLEDSTTSAATFSRYLYEFLPLLERWTLWMALARPSPMQRHSTTFALLDSMDGASTLADTSEIIQWLRKCTDEYEFGATAGGKRLAAAILRRMNAHLITEEKKNVPSEEKAAASSVELIRQDWSSEGEKEEMANRLGNLALVTSTSSQRKANNKSYYPSRLLPSSSAHLVSSLVPSRRCLSTADLESVKRRNIGISAHIDSGKTTLTERILFYTGRIKSIHDVRGKDGVGAKMDSMDLEREKGITIQSAATFCRWKDAHVNIIDTPGHVDFTIEVERALRVLDGGILVLCGVSGVQSQSLTVDRQMKRYDVPRLAFVNKLDRQGSNPWKVIDELRNQLKLNACAVQLPIGLEDKHSGVVDLITQKSYVFEGEKGEDIVEGEIPADMAEMAGEKRLELVERLADVDDEIGELFLMEEEPTEEQLKAAIRRQTVACNFVPVFMGSAFKNKGVQKLLDGVVDYLPEPAEKQNFALDRSKDEARVEVTCKKDDPLLALAFKLEETPFGQLTYMRIYQGTLKKGSPIVNVNDGKKIKLSRIVRMHSDEMEEIDEAHAGDVVAMFGIDCRSMDTFGDGNMDIAMSSMFVPEPVLSLAVKPAESKMQNNFAKALVKFTKEDPTLRVKVDSETKETVLSGMGELHLEVYLERMKREYNVECVSGEPNVNYKETIAAKTTFDWLHKKQTGGSGQYAKVVGYMEPMSEEEVKEHGKPNEFKNKCIGTNIPPEYYPSCEKGMNDAMAEGALVGCEVEGVRVVLQDGASHAVDSSDMAFRICMAHAIRDTMKKARPSILEPIMSVEIDIPAEFQGAVTASLSRRMGMIQSSDVNDDGSGLRMEVQVPLANMFGYSTELRSLTQGKGEFSMEYFNHSPVARNVQEELMAKYREEKEAEAA
ncbi:hypothetical protein ACHAXT_004999 [Thalassiosira profunda]